MLTLQRHLPKILACFSKCPHNSHIVFDMKISFSSQNCCHYLPNMTQNVLAFQNCPNFMQQFFSLCKSILTFQKCCDFPKMPRLNFIEMHVPNVCTFQRGPDIFLKCLHFTRMPSLCKNALTFKKCPHLANNLNKNILTFQKVCTWSVIFKNVFECFLLFEKLLKLKEMHAIL